MLPWQLIRSPLKSCFVFHYLLKTMPIFVLEGYWAHYSGTVIDFLLYDIGNIYLLVFSLIFYSVFFYRNGLCHLFIKLFMLGYVFETIDWEVRLKDLRTWFDELIWLSALVEDEITKKCIW